MTKRFSILFVLCFALLFNVCVNNRAEAQDAVNWIVSPYTDTLDIGYQYKDFPINIYCNSTPKLHIDSLNYSFSDGEKTFFVSNRSTTTGAFSSAKLVINPMPGLKAGTHSSVFIIQHSAGRTEIPLQITVRDTAN